MDSLKNQLKNACQSSGIKYIHIPQLGIDSQHRQELHSMSDYNKLFKKYENTTLVLGIKNTSITSFELVTEFKRVAITCFEKEICMYHRGRVFKCFNSNASMGNTHTKIFK